MFGLIISYFSKTLGRPGVEYQSEELREVVVRSDAEDAGMRGMNETLPPSTWYHASSAFPAFPCSSSWWTLRSRADVIHSSPIKDFPTDEYTSSNGFYTQNYE